MLEGLEPPPPIFFWRGQCPPNILGLIATESKCYCHSNQSVSTSNLDFSVGVNLPGWPVINYPPKVFCAVSAPLIFVSLIRLCNGMPKCIESLTRRPTIPRVESIYWLVAQHRCMPVSYLCPCTLCVHISILLIGKRYFSTTSGNTYQADNQKETNDALPVNA